MIFLSDYDMLLTGHLVQGVDVWINTPRRPWEACGTSGMKVLVNGGLNLSELDGWWAEAYQPDVGWALGDGQDHGDDPAWDAAEAEALYDRLERDVIPEFYTRDETGIPVAWVGRMRESMARLTPRFSAERAVREYTESHYRPAADAFRARAADACALGRRIVAWRHVVEQQWPALRFDSVKVEAEGTHQAFEVAAVGPRPRPGRGARGTVCERAQRRPPVPADDATHRPLRRCGRLVGLPRAHPATRPATDYTVRVVPHHDGVAVPLETPSVLWQR